MNLFSPSGYTLVESKLLTRILHSSKQQKSQVRIQIKKKVISLHYSSPFVSSLYTAFCCSSIYAFFPILIPNKKFVCWIFQT